MSNGDLPDSALTTVQGAGQNAVRLSNGYAAVYGRMQADAAADGVTINLVASFMGAAGYRSYATELDMRARPSLYDITPGIIPGLPSVHHLGSAADYNAGLAWVKENGHRYGVSFPIANDHNHGVWDGTTLADLGTTFITEPEKEEDEMKLIVHPNGQHGFTDSVLTFLQPDYTGTVVDLIPIYGKPVPATPNAWQFIADRVAENRAALGLPKQ